MKGGTVQITWHGSDPVLSLDFHRLSGLLATGGADHDIKFWTLYEAVNAPLPSATFHSSLSYHTAAVNVVRFSAAGDQLASGADGGEILLWRLTENTQASNMWKLAKNLRFHVKDVLDLQWSSDGTLLVSGSVDNTVIIWDIVKGNPQQVLKDHMHYVQGVALDPIGQYIASISGDRTCRIYCNKPQNFKGKSQDRHNFSCQSVLVKTEVSKQEDEATTAAAKLNLFHDETLPSFFRRLAWSPDGSFLLVPAGIHKLPSQSDLTNTAFIISRKDLSRPAVQLPGASKPVVAVRFCPVMFSCHANAEQNLDKESIDTGVFKLPYRLVFAVATLNSLFVYDTQSSHPLAVLAGIHYAAITDIAWSCDGKFLAVSSQDGFCTLVAFDQEELGSPLPLSELPSYIAKFLPHAKDKVGGQQDRQPNASSVNSGNSGTPVNQEANAASEFVRPASASPIKPVQELQHAGCKDATSSKDNMVSGTDGVENPPSSPKMPRRITPMAVDASGPTQQMDKIENLQSSPKRLRRITPVAVDTSGSAQQMDKLENPQSSPKGPRRITPVAVDVRCPSEQMDKIENPQSSSKAPRRITPVAVDASGSAQQMDKLENPQTSPKGPMRITPVAVDVSCPTEQMDKIESPQSSPKGPRRITPMAVDVSGSTQQMNKLENPQSSPKGPRRITPLAVDAACTKELEKIETAESSLKRPRRITPVLMDVTCTGQEIGKIESAQSSPKKPEQITAVAMNVSCSKQETGRSENTQSSPKKPKQFTPVVVDMSCAKQQIADMSGDENKGCQAKQ